MYASQVDENSFVNSSARLKDKNLFIDEFSIYLIADKTAGETIRMAVDFFSDIFAKIISVLARRSEHCLQRRVPPTRSSVVSAFQILASRNRHTALDLEQNRKVSQL